MSRSRPPKCSCGRGCWVCGDAGEARRVREQDAARADARDLQAELDALMFYDDGYDGDEQEQLIWGSAEPLRVPLIDVLKVA